MISLVAYDADRTDLSLGSEGFTGDQAINSNVCFASKECYIACLLATVQPYLVTSDFFQLNDWRDENPTALRIYDVSYTIFQSRKAAIVWLEKIPPKALKSEF